MYNIILYNIAVTTIFGRKYQNMLYSCISNLIFLLVQR